MSIKELISIVDKSEAPSKNDGMNKVYHDLFEELKSNLDRIITTYRHRPSQKITIEIYPDLPTFHQAINEPLAPKWLTHGLGGHEAKQMSQEYIQYSTSEAIQNNAVPSF
ncbi:MAG: hypothetical protein NAG76_14235 [Candidatus Pristimantibacillus lignocellulolyticus]|uniref:Uncharacterized protein n=1 Tax=Candidatus Pristimantibacillus lignocellulolyticus TaxID=2994561 RepID=A0A9J6Z9X1_9BACL|nr:MAG: hypothetical protein NAG76_14235 [Candidatus Pristimantibacillus lignocellulolyticus]